MPDILTVPTPALVLDRGIARRNMARMRAHLAAVAPGMPLRPHLKSAKSVAVADMLFDGGRGPITVSTLREAEVFSAAGFADILYAVGIAPGKLGQVLGLRQRGTDLKIITDDFATASAIRDAAQGQPLPTLIEIDVDGHRAGLRYDDLAAIVGLARRLGPCFAGILTHAGGSYALSGMPSLEQAAAAEAHRSAAVANALCEAGLAPAIVSIGSTPTALAARRLDGITEVRAGVYMFCDLVMHGVGVCAVEDIALSVVTSVIGTYPDRDMAIVDAGWMALSRDRGTAGQAVDQGYGLVCSADGRPLDDVIVSSANQEHGIVALRPGSTGRFPRLRVGDRLRILPNHACATAAQHGRYEIVEDGAPQIVATWERFSGW